MPKRKGFTLIELLIVIGILAMLATIVVLILNPAALLREARSSNRVRDLRVLEKALAIYSRDTGGYPNSQAGAGPWDGLYVCGGGDATPNWIPGLTPNYVAQLPRDPRNHTVCGEQYKYNSNGRDYKLISDGVEDCAGLKAKYPQMVDPVRDCTAIGFWTPGAAGW